MKNKDNYTTTHIDGNLQETFIYNNEIDLPIRFKKSDFSFFSNGKGDCHWHKEIEILIVTHGSMYCYVNQNKYRIETNQGIFINANRLHYSACDETEECKYLLFQFSTSLLSNNTFIINKLIKPIINENNVDCFLLRKSDWTSKVLQIMHDILNLCFSEEDGYQLLVQSKLLQAWHVIYSNNEVNYSENNNIKINEIKNMIEFIHFNYKDKIKLNDIAKSGSVSRTKCYNLFTLIMGQSPIEYLNYYRILKSTEDLRYSNNSITTISQDCGFSSASHFTQTFNKIIGNTPYKYRTYFRGKTE